MIFSIADFPFAYDCRAVKVVDLSRIAFEFYSLIALSSSLPCLPNLRVTASASQQQLKSQRPLLVACDRVTELDEFDELQTLHKSLYVIKILAWESKLGVSSVGGVKIIVEVMKTFPKCHALQENTCLALGNLAPCNLGKKKAVASGGLQLLLAAVNNHLESAKLCHFACWALSNVVAKSAESAELLISLGGGAAVAKVRKKWPDDEDVQPVVLRLAKLLAAEMNSWVNEE
jgi:hypothetical protein